MTTSRRAPARPGRPVSDARTPRDSTRENSTASTEGIRSRMQLQRTRNTGPELAVRRLLHARGLRYRVDQTPLPGFRRRADIVFPRNRVAVYIDGCFWHGCREHGTRPSRNNAFWAAKLATNRSRDIDTDLRLNAAGWKVIRVWEHDDPAAVADLVHNTVLFMRRKP